MEVYLIIKRNYNKSNTSLGKDKIVWIGNKAVILGKDLYNYLFSNLYVNTITKKNINKMVDIQDIVLKKEKVIYNHRGFVEGINITNNNDINLSYFSTATSKEIHDIDLDLQGKDLENLVNINVDFKIPTLNMPNNIAIKIETGFDLRFKGMTKIPVIKNIKIEEKNIVKLPKGLNKEMQERSDKVMEIYGMKNYEFFSKEGKLYGLHKDNIYREGELILGCDIKKLKPVNLEEYLKICKEIANNSELDKYIQLDMKTKEMFENNYKILSDLKKD